MVEVVEVVEVHLVQTKFQHALASTGKKTMDVITPTLNQDVVALVRVSSDFFNRVITKC